MGLDKSKAVGPCLKLGDHCPPGHFCASDKECYPKKSEQKLKRDAEGQNIGPCVNGLCPEEYTCTDNVCHKSKNVLQRPFILQISFFILSRAYLFYTVL